MFSKEEILENRKKWIEALKSNDYQQGQYYLEKDNLYCCLGVACKVLNPKLDIRMRGTLSNDRETRRIMQLLGIGTGEENKLVELNDKTKLSFLEIADYISSFPIHHLDENFIDPLYEDDEKGW